MVARPVGLEFTLKKPVCATHACTFTFESTCLRTRQFFPVYKEVTRFTIDCFKTRTDTDYESIDSCLQ